MIGFPAFPRRLYAAAAVVLLAAAAASGQPKREVVWLGTGGAFSAAAREGVWCQRVLSIENYTDSDRKVKVACVADVPGRGTTYYSRICLVPAKANRRVEVALRPGRMQRLSRIDPSKKLTGREVYEENYVIWDARTGGKLHGDSRPLNKILPGRTAVGVIMGATHGDESYSYLDGLNDEPLGTVQLFGSSGKYATRWYGYSMLDLLFLTDLDTSRIRSSQVKAILNWVRRGGVLVVAGAETYGETFQQELTEATGVTAVGVHYVSRMSISGLDRRGIKEVELRTPLPMAEFLLVDARVVLECNKLPLLTVRRCGMGTVFTLATPLAALRDKTLHSLWRRVKDAMDSLPAVNSDDFAKPREVKSEVSALASDLKGRMDRLPPTDQEKAHSVIEALEAFGDPGSYTVKMLAGRRAPPRWVPVAMLVVIAGLVAVAGLLLRIVRRGEILWGVLVPVALIVSVVLYGIGLSRSSPERLSFVGVVTSLGDGVVRVQEVCQYYSGPDRHELTFSAGTADGVIRDIGQVGSAAMSLSETRTAGRILLPDQTIETNGTAGFYIDAVCPTPGLKPELTFDRSGLAGTIRNELGFALSDAVIYAGGRTYRLGDIPEGSRSVSVGRGDRMSPVQFTDLRARLNSLLLASAPRPAAPGATRPRRAPPARTPPPEATALVQRAVLRTARGEFTSAWARTPADAHRNRLLGYLISAPRHQRKVDDGPVLIAYGSGSMLDSPVGRPLERQGWSVVVWPLEFQSPPRGTAVSIPSGLLRLRFPRKGATVYDPITRYNAIRTNSGLLVHAHPPSAIGLLRDAKAVLTITVRAKGFRMTIYGMPPGGAEQEKLGSFDRPLGIMTVEAPRAERFRDASGAYAFWIYFEQLDPQADERGAGDTFGGVEVDLEGITK